MPHLKILVHNIHVYVDSTAMLCNNIKVLLNYVEKSDTYHLKGKREDLKT